MKSIVRVIIALLVCFIIIFGAYTVAMGMMDSIYQYRSPLEDSAPIPGLAIKNTAPRQVVFILIDALRYDTSLKSEVMPTLSQLRSKGAYARMHSKTPSYSSPGYGVLLTGAWPELSSSAAFNLSYEDIRTLTQDNLFSSAHRLGLTTGISALNWFEKLVPQYAVDLSYYTAGEDQIADRDVVNAALPWIQKGDGNFILIHIDQVDHAGHHEGGPENPNWDAAAGRADALVAEILAKMDLTKDVIFICSDHGQIDAGGHGGQEQVVRTEPFIMAGKGIKQGDFGEVEMVDVAPTLAAILGINLPASTQGEVQVAMLAGLNAATLESIPLESARQQVQLLQKYSTAIGVTIPAADLSLDKIKTVDEYQRLFEKTRNQRLNRERLPRMLIALVSLVLAGLMIWRWNFFQRRKYFLGALIYLFIFNLIYLVIGPGAYSYSTIVTESSFIVINGLISILSMMLVWFIFVFPGRKRLSAANLAAESAIFAVVTAILTFLPVIVHWVWNGLFVTWALPNLLFHYIALLSLVQSMFIGISGVILAVASLILNRNKKGIVS